MIVSSADTAELRLSAEPPVFAVPSPSEAPPIGDAQLGVAPVDFNLVAVLVTPPAVVTGPEEERASSTPCRAELVAVRRRLRSEQRRLAYLSIGILATAFGATVAILDTIH
jgi:hypothetical protein